MGFYFGTKEPHHGLKLGVTSISDWRANFSHIITLFGFWAILLVMLLTANDTHAQTDSIPSILKRLQGIEEFMRQDTTSRLLEGTRAAPMPDSSRSGISFSGSGDFYYSYYSDHPKSEYVKFPTVAPRHNSFGLNLLMLGVKYDSKRLRGTAILQAGDIPVSAWSPQFNFIQEANAGIRFARNVWFDFGFFRTHIGIESIQPRENVCASIDLATYYMPYFFSGAKVTWYPREDFFIQANVFNGFNSFVENNKSKDAGLSIHWSPKNFTLNYNFLYGDDAPADSAFSQPRFYQNIYGSWTLERLLLAYDLALSFEKHAPLHPENGYSLMYSATGIFQYSISKRLSAYARGSWFSDPHETLTGPIENDFHDLVGLQAASLTAGFQVKPTFNSYIRLEGRGIKSMGEDPEIFFWNGAPSVYRVEGVICSGIGF